MHSSLSSRSGPGQGRDAADPRRRQRHRDDSDPAGQARGRHRGGHRGLAGQARRLPPARCRHLINYREDDFAEKLLAETGGHGADVILDIIGAGYLTKNLAALAPDGRIANIGLQQGRRAELDLNTLMAKRGDQLDHAAGPPGGAKAAIVAAVGRVTTGRRGRAALWWGLTRLPMSEAAEAHRIMDASGHTGKIVLLAQ